MNNKSFYDSFSRIEKIYESESGRGEFFIVSDGERFFDQVEYFAFKYKDRNSFTTWRRKYDHEYD